ncbi:uncharacterized protein LOC113549772 [Rhopalosiphum maidis]|uniref:uncharacterized protein LOC113549772 n=1 Tax=Rhopalosiphum maidis TaxID=43146 RepID=UPI000EFF91C9|nr:uncharacterized protein LOC113549772 [Rhopalosiphum maidis]
MSKKVAQDPNSFRIQPIKREPQNILPKLNEYIKQKHDIVHEHNVKQEHVDESTESKLYYNRNDSQSTNQYYTKDFKNTKANIKFQINTKVDVFNDSEYESFFMRDNSYVPSVASSTYYNINSHIENKPTNFNLKIESSTETYMPTKHKVIKSEQKKNQTKNEVNVIDNAVFEKHVIHNDKFRPSVESTTYDIESHVEINPRNLNINHNINASTKTLKPTKHKTVTYENNTQIKTEIDIIDDTMYESFFYV